MSATPEPTSERRRSPEQLAYAAGRRDADVDNRLRSHEARLNAINGSIDRAARHSEALGDKVDAVIARLDQNAALEEQRNEQLRQANDKQISAKTFWLGVAMLCVVLGVGIATIIATYSGGH